MSLRLSRRGVSSTAMDLRPLSTSSSLCDRRQSQLENNCFSIDIGVHKPFRVRIARAIKFTLLADDECKVCIKVHYNANDADVMVLKWSDIQRDCNSRDHITSVIGSSVVTVPKYKSKEVYNHHGKFVSVTLRSYIVGNTFQHVMPFLTDDDVDAIQLQVEAITWALAKKTSPHFGHVQDDTLRTSSASGYIRTRSFLDKLTAKMDWMTWNEIGTDGYVGTAVFCHGALTPEHIILNGNDVVGIVGWSNADFKPEVYDRLMYYFMSVPRDPNCWSRKMANVPSSPSTPPPSVEFVVNTTDYAYKSAWSTATMTRRLVLDKLWNAVKKNYTLVTCLSTAVEIESDTMSLSSLSNWTESTWDKSAAPTIIADDEHLQ